jgi:hypothetical protein
MAAPKPVVLCILDGWGLREETDLQRARPGRYPQFRPADGHLPARDACHPRARCGAAHRADGQFRGRAHQYRRGPYRGDGPRADRPCDRGWQFCAAPRAAAFHRPAEGNRRHRASDGARLARRRSQPPAPHRRDRPDRGGGGHPGADPRDHRRPRRAAEIGTGTAGRARRRPARGARGSAASSGAISRWTATTAGNGCRRPSTSPPRARRCARPRPPRPPRAPRYAAGETDEFIRRRGWTGYAPPADGDGLLFVNFRADRAREILAALGRSRFRRISTSPPGPTGRRCCGMVEYSDRHNSFMDVIFPKQDIGTRWAPGWRSTGCGSSALPKPRNTRTSPSS